MAEWGVSRVGEIEQFPDEAAAREFADRYVYGLPGVAVVTRSGSDAPWSAVCGPGDSPIWPEPTG